MDDVMIISKHGIAFCRSCAYAVRSNVLSKHFANVHKLTAEDSRMKQQIFGLKKLSNSASNYQLDQVTFKGIRKNNFVDGEVYPALNLLPMLTAWQCKACWKIMGSAESGRKHIVSCKKVMRDLHCCLETVQAQALFGGNNRRYFLVKCDEDANAANDRWWLADMIGELKGSVPAVNFNSSYDSRIRDGFLGQMGFDIQLEAVNGLNLSSARSFCVIYNPDDEKRVRFVVKAYLKQAFDIIRKKVWANMHRFMGEEFHIELSESSVMRYVGHVVVLLRFFRNVVFHVKEGTWGTYLFDKNHDQAMNISLQESFKHFFTGANGCDRDAVALFMNENDDDWQSLLPHLHVLLKALFLTPFKEDGQVIPLFLACYSVVLDSEGKARVQGDSITGASGMKFIGQRQRSNDALRYCTASEMSPLLAALKYLIQCIVLNEVYGNCRESSLEKWATVEEWERPNIDNGASYVHYAMRVAMRVKGSEGTRIRFMKCPQHERCGIIDGIEIRIDAVASIVINIQRKVYELINHKLLFGVVLGNSFWEQLHDMRDCLRDRTPGYWFGSHPDNSVSINFWLNSMLKNSRASRLFKNTDGESLETGEARQFVEDCQKLQACIYVLCQLTGGGPARSTEAALIQCRNTSFGSRNIILTRGQIAILTFYHKGRSKAGGVSKPILRFPDAVTGGIIAIYLLLIKPVEMAVGRKLGLGPDDRQAWIDQDMMFSYRGLRTNESRLRTYFESEMKTGGIPIGTAQYRQYFTGIVKHFFRDDISNTLETEDKTISDVMHHQAGHCEGTAHECYGVSDIDMRRLTSSELEAFRHASEKWHRVLGIKHGKVTKFTTGTVDRKFDKISLPTCNGNSSIQKPSNVLVEKNKKNMCSEDGRMLEDNETILLKTQENFTALHESQREQYRILSKKVDDMFLFVKENMKLSNNLHSGNGNKRSYKSSQVDERYSGEDVKEIFDSSKRTKKLSPEEMYQDAKGLCSERKLQLLGYLQRALRCGQRVKFRSEEQEIASHFLCGGHSDSLLVLPTGGGKSLLYIMAAIANPTKVVIVIVPTIALEVDITRRCQENGINVCCWSERDVAEIGILLVSAEHVSGTEYVPYIKKMHDLERIHCVVLDEAHLFSTWSHFRPLMRNISKVIRPQDVTCALIAQSATVPPTEERQIIAHCGLKFEETVIVRGRTSRKNIRYETHVHRMEDMFYEIVMTLNKMRRENTNRSRSGALIIVYCTSHNECQEMSREILDSCNPNHIESFVYHAGIEKREKIEVYKKWVEAGSRKVSVICATSAFGCGVDIGNIRTVIHAGVPYSVSDFSQESGRCARDGLVGRSVLFLPTEAAKIVSWRAMRSQSTGIKFVNFKGNMNVEDERESGLSKERGKTGLGTSADFLKWMDVNNLDCRRWTLDLYLDGITEKARCFELKFECCDACERYQESCFVDGKILSVNNGEEGGVVENGSAMDVNRGKRERGCIEEGRRCSDRGNGSTPGTDCSNHRSRFFHKRESIKKKLFTEEMEESSSSGDELGKEYYGSSPSEVMRLAKDLNVMCPICSVEKCREVYHCERNQGTPEKECFKGRCLRCGSKMHRFCECPLRQVMMSESGVSSKVWSGAGSRKCFQCGLGVHEEKNIHERGSFGNRKCSLKNVVRVGVVAWEDSKRRKEIMEKFPETRCIESTSKFMEWLGEYRGEKRELNIAVTVRHVINSVMNGWKKE